MRIENESAWIAKVTALAHEIGEVLVYIRYLYNAPTMQFAFIKNSSEARELVSICPKGAKLYACSQSIFTYRGPYTKAYLRELENRLPENSYECVFIRNTVTDPRLDGIGCMSKASLLSELEELILDSDYQDCRLALGNLDNCDPVVMIKDNFDGPR